MTSPEVSAPAGDPSMEDILASIRRILADDEGSEAEGAGIAEPVPAHDAGGLSAGAAAEADPEDVFVLDQTMVIEEPASMQSETETPPMPESAAGTQDFSHLDAGALPEVEPLMAPGAAAATTASLGALVRVVSQRQQPVYRGGPTLEDMVRDEIRSLVKVWLDENLAPMVERMVRVEIERVTSQAR